MITKQYTISNRIYEFIIQNITLRKMFSSSIFGAIETGDVDRVLRYKGSFPIDENGWTSLHYAVQSGSIEMVRLILSREKSLVNKKSVYNRITPLHLAVMSRKMKIARLLLRNGASNKSRTRKGFAAKQIAKQNKK